MTEQEKELQQQIDRLKYEVETIKERLEDLKPLAQFAREQEERRDEEEAALY